MSIRLKSLGVAGAALLVFSLACAGHKYHLVTAPAVPAARGTVQVGSDHNGNTTIDLKVKNLVKPNRSAAPQSGDQQMTQLYECAIAQ